MKILAEAVIYHNSKHHIDWNETLRITINKANDTFGFYPDGECAIPGYERSCCYLEVKFMELKVNVGMTGREIIFKFKAMIVKEE